MWHWATPYMCVHTAFARKRLFVTTTYISIWSYRCSFMTISHRWILASCLPHWGLSFHNLTPHCFYILGIIQLMVLIIGSYSVSFRQERLFPFPSFMAIMTQIIFDDATLSKKGRFSMKMMTMMIVMNGNDGKRHTQMINIWENAKYHDVNKLSSSGASWGRGH